MDDKTLRTHLVKMLTEANAHATFEDIIEDFPVTRHGATVEKYPHSAWQLLEHLRIAQWDIVEFSRDPNHVSPAWPDEYWPQNANPPSEQAWNKSVAEFKADLKRMVKMIEDESNDLFEPFEHGDGQTLLREALVLAKHNSYHLGQLAVIKKAKG
jgi:hypothetical protein